MDRDILNVLLEYRKIDNSQRQISSVLLEADLFDVGVTERKSGILSGLDSNFAESTVSFFEEVTLQGCPAIAINGVNKNATPITTVVDGKQVSIPSPHQLGKALDVQFKDEKCYCTAIDICTKYSGLFCQDLRTRKKVKDWTEPHLHISERKENDAKTIPCSSKGAYKYGSASTELLEPDTGVFDFAEKIAPLVGIKTKSLKENFSLGKDVQKSYNDYIIPASSNKKLYSPIDGKVISYYEPGCNNSIFILSSDNSYYLRYCNVGNILVNKNDTISKGTLLGELGENDVVSSILTSSMKKTSDQKLSNSQTDKENELIKKNKALQDKYDELRNKKNKDDNNYDSDYEYEYKEPFQFNPMYDPGATDFIDVLTYPFRNRYDRSGKLIQKNWGSPTEKRQPDKFKFLKSPTKKAKTGDEVIEKPTSEKKFGIFNWFKSPSKDKVDENINRIKKLLN